MKKKDIKDMKKTYSFNNSVRRAAKALTLSAGFGVLLTAPMTALASSSTGSSSGSSDLSTGGTSFTTIASNGQAAVQSFASLAIYVGIFMGIVFVIGGLIWWIMAHKKHEPTWPAIAAMIGGFLLTSVTAYIDSGSQTVFGSNQSQVSTLISSSSTGTTG